MSNSSDRAPTAQNNEPLWVDSHCHLDMLKLLSGEALEFDGDQDPITEPFLKALSDELQLAYAAGVGHFLCVSVDVSRYEHMRRAASVSPRVAHSAGIHPSTLESRPEAQWIDVL
ncbi:MAG: TatD family hydrolase, partial [Gammaproteobacteria bacterium]